MRCKQCGSPNRAGTGFCMKCGAPLDDAPPKQARSVKKAVLVAVLLAGVPIIAAAIIVIILISVGASVSGPWHNEEMNQVLRFHEDGTVIVHTPEGISEATYVFETNKGQGVISLNGAAIAFSVQKDSLTLTGAESFSQFVRGDMDIVAAMANATPAATPTETQAPAVTPTSAPSHTPGTTPTPAATPTDAPEATSTAAPASPSPHLSVPPALTLKPGIDPEDLPPLFDSVEGDWYGYGLTLTFYDDNTYEINFGSLLNESGDYTYEAVTKEGKLIQSGGTVKFTVSGDTLTLETGGAFVRQP